MMMLLKSNILPQLTSFYLVLVVVLLLKSYLFLFLLLLLLLLCLKTNCANQTVCHSDMRALDQQVVIPHAAQASIIGLMVALQHRVLCFLLEYIILVMNHNAYKQNACNRQWYRGQLGGLKFIL